MESPVAGFGLEVGVLVSLDCFLVGFGFYDVLEVFPGGVGVEAEFFVGSVTLEILDLSLKTKWHGLFFHKLGWAFYPLSELFCMVVVKLTLMDREMPGTSIPKITSMYSRIRKWVLVS